LDKDTELIERARNGDITAFKELVNKHKRNVYYLAYDLMRCKEDAEDVSQEVFMKAFKSLKSFRGDSKFSSWLYRITANTCYSLKSRKSYSSMKASDDIENIVDTKHEMKDYKLPDPENVTESGFIKKAIEKALLKLSEKERIIFIMRNYNEMSFEEITEVLKLRPGTVRSSNFNALRKLRKELAFYKNDI
jgi:RNA polymerase sigma-70 factor, ECF subfamily